ncbi:MAG: hypothetical protein LJE96_20140, partial [Deltaproteobacteria bacterium]|nr:hypothetical protein [Deltaproteobacteria bacterium]
TRSPVQKHGALSIMATVGSSNLDSLSAGRIGIFAIFDHLAIYGHDIDIDQALFHQPFYCDYSMINQVVR